jgi:hypothetical protein
VVVSSYNGPHYKNLVLGLLGHNLKLLFFPFCDVAGVRSSFSFKNLLKPVLWFGKFGGYTNFFVPKWRKFTKN